MMLNKNYWENRYKNRNTGWDLGQASPPLTAYFDQLIAKDLKILIPGAGFGHEAVYLFEAGFTNVTVIDLSAFALKTLQKKLPDVSETHFIKGDFFEHTGSYDLIVEQTFFCAIDPQLRSQYVQHCFELLNPFGKVAGILFDTHFTQNGPPFGGSIEEYIQLFSPLFKIRILERCYNSIKPRQGNELFFIFENKQQPAN